LTYKLDYAIVDPRKLLLQQATTPGNQGSVEDEDMSSELQAIREAEFVLRACGVTLFFSGYLGIAMLEEWRRRTSYERVVISVITVATFATSGAAFAASI
jgi:hypothetical protein